MKHVLKNELDFVRQIFDMAWSNLCCKNKAHMRTGPPLRLLLHPLHYPPLRSREDIRDDLTEKRRLESAHGREAINFATRRRLKLDHLPCHRSRLSTSFLVVPGFRSPSLPRIYRPIHKLAYHKSLTKCLVYTQTSLNSPICADELRDSSQVTTGWQGYSQL
jgi:hypothetical protein